MAHGHRRNYTTLTDATGFPRNHLIRYAFTKQFEYMAISKVEQLRTLASGNQSLRFAKRRRHACWTIHIPYSLR